jgi:hypothetical protein
MADGEVSLRPMALRPGGITSGNPFMTFGKGAGVGLVKKVRGVAAFGVGFGPSLTYVSDCLRGIGVWLDEASTDNPRNVCMLTGPRKQPFPGGAKEETSRRDREVHKRVPYEVQRGGDP